MSDGISVEPGRSGEGILAVPGLRGAGLAAGIKESGSRDLALVVADRPRPASAVFTTNAAAAAPVRRCREVLDECHQVRAFVVNAGNANALTGPRGDEDAMAMEWRVRERCGGPALVFSTGVIGVPLPLDRVLDGIDHAAEQLSEDAGLDVAEAILTTDTRMKTESFVIELPAEGVESRRRVTLGGTAKGSGMIHPDMATMLAFMATDAPVAPELLDRLLREVVDESFHSITVDGDTSTNDSVLLLGGVLTRGEIIRSPGSRYRALREGVGRLADSLARQIVEDGEGAERWMELTVSGGRDRDEARRIARSISTSSLVKTALAGGDPNWGRILSAAGNSGVPLDLSALRLRLGGLLVFDQGAPRPHDAGEARAAFAGRRVVVHLEVGDGPGRASMTTTDLTRGYVEINSLYRT